MEIDVQKIKDQSLEALNGLTKDLRVPSKEEVKDFVQTNSKTVARGLSTASRKSYEYVRENPWSLAVGVFALGWVAYRLITREREYV